MNQKKQRVQAAADAVKHQVSFKLSKIWWSFLLRGLLAIALACCALFWPQKTLDILIKLLGGYLVVDGVARAIGSYRSGENRAQLITAIVSLTAGLVLWFWTGMSERLFMVLIGIWALAQGASMCWSSWKMESDESIRGQYGLAGLAIAVLGVAFIAWPGTGTVTISWLLAAAAFVIGGLMIYLAIKLMKIKRVLSARIKKGVEKEA